MSIDQSYADALKENADLRAKLEKVEADAACMRQMILECDWIPAPKSDAGQRLLDELATLRATANHLASEGWVRLKWMPGTERPEWGSSWIGEFVSGNPIIGSCTCERCMRGVKRWLYASELLSDKAKEGEQ